LVNTNVAFNNNLIVFSCATIYASCPEADLDA